MVQIITAGTSVENPAGNGFTGLAVDPDKNLLVNANAFLISDAGGNGARLLGSGWNVTINGEVGAFGGGFTGLFFAGDAILTIGKTGSVFSGVDTGADAIECGGAITLVNFGTVAGDVEAIQVPGLAKITNAGTFVGDVLTGGSGDTFTNFKKVNGIIKHGTVDGLIDLGGGADTFNGGAKAETVRDAAGDDTYNFGKGNDTYIAFNGIGSNDDIVNGGKGIDTYDASAAVGFLTVNLTTHLTAGDVGIDTVNGFENVIGSDGGCSLTGSSVANSLIGGADNDILVGLGGRDVLTGGADGDTFRFLALSDSGPKASARDLITDFTQGGPGISDIIDLSTIDAKTGGLPDDDFTFIGVSNFTGVKGQLRQSYSGGNTIISGDVNGDGKADFSFALKGHFLMSGVDGVDINL
jgi:Ca2+-binding RTX toxin-like protein